MKVWFADFGFKFPKSVHYQPFDAKLVIDFISFYMGKMFWHDCYTLLTV